jgi:uncharacterized protein YecT (DUF1311 family)
MGKGTGASLLTALLLAPAGAAQAALPPYRMVMTPEEGPVDRTVEARYTAAFHACQDRSVTTDDNAHCYLDESDRQDGRLNATWRTVFAATPPAQREALRAAQRRWIAARDPFCWKVADEFSGGTIMPVIYHNCQAEQAIRRTMWLEGLVRK